MYWKDPPRANRDAKPPRILNARYHDCIRINVTVFKKVRTRAVWLRLSGGGLVF